MTEKVKRKYGPASRIIALVLLLTLSAVAALQLPPIQKAIGDKVSAAISSNLGGRLECKEVIVLPFNSVLLKDVALIDPTPYVSHDPQTQWPVVDTVLKAGTITVSIRLSSLLTGNGLVLTRVHIDDASIIRVVEVAPRRTRHGMSVMNNISRILRSNPDKEKKERQGEVLRIRKLKLKNFSFAQFNYSKKAKKPYESGINWKHFGFNAESVAINDLRIVDGHTTGQLKLNSVSEYGGYRLNSLNCSFDVSPHKSIVQDIHINDRVSDINLSELDLEYDNNLSFRSFKEKVSMTIDFDDSHIDTWTLNQFSGRRVFQDNLLHIRSGRYDGYIRDFTVDALNLTDSKGGVSTVFDLSLCGLPDKINSSLNGQIRQMRFTPKGLLAFAGTFSKKGIKAKGISDNSIYDLQCDISGSLNRFGCNLYVNRGESEVEAGLVLSNVTDSKPMAIDGDVRINSLDIGNLLGKSFIGCVNLNTDLKCVLQKGNPLIYAGNIKSDGFTAIGHDFNGLTATMALANHELDCKLSVSDPAVKLDFDGTLDLSDRKNPGYDFFASLRDADLSLAKFTKKHITLSADIAARTGKLFISDITLADSCFTYPVGKAEVSMSGNEDCKTIALRSDVLDMDFRGVEGFKSMIQELKLTTTYRELPALHYKKPAEHISGDYHLYSNIKQPRLVLPHFFPSLFFSDSTEINIDLTSGDARGQVKSSRLAVGTEYIKGIDLSFDNSGNSFNTNLTAEEIKIRKMIFMNPTLKGVADSDSLTTVFHYDVEDKSQESSDVFLNASFGRDSNDSLKIEARTLPSGLVIGDKYWNLYDSDILLSGRTLSFQDLRMLSDNQFITIDGGLSRTLKDTLRIRVNELGLNFANKVSKGEHNISGILNAYAIVTSPLSDDFNLIGKAEIDTLKVGGLDIGAVKASAAWDAGTRKIVFLGRNIYGGDELLNLRGSYTPNSKDMNAQLSLNHFEMAGMSPFLDNLFNSISGHINGRIDMNMHDGVFNLQSSGTRLDSIKVNLKATDANYVLDGPFQMAGDTIRLDDIKISDKSDGHGKLSGHLIISKKHKSSIDMRVSLDKLDILDKPAGTAGAIYGNMSANCAAHIHGPLNNIRMEVDASTSGQGNVHVSLAQSSGNKNSDLLTFKERERYIDPYEALLKSLELKKKKTTSNVSLHADIGITPETEAVIELDKQGGNVLTASGTGRLSYDIDSETGLSSLKGIYTINSGKFRFSTLGNLINKNFTIRSGGFLKFNGDLNNSDIDVTADYTLKTSISPLIADTTSITTRKKVICGLRISNKISSPQISFSIDIPDLDPSTRSLVETALNTEDKVQKQFVALLVTGNFIQDEQSGVYFSQSNILYKNLYDIMSGQLNNILQKLDIPIDLGLNYIESNTGQNAFDVAVSTQLFNNRVLVNGSFGNRKNKVAHTENDMVGNIDIEIKIDKNGELRFTLFSHSPDAYNNWLDKSQRNGLGLTYQKEYTNLAEFFKSIFLKKEERDKRELERKRDMLNNRKVIKVQ